MHLETITMLAADSWTWRPMIAPLHLAVAAGALAALAIAAYARSMSPRWLSGLALLAMRLMVLAALVTLLMGPSVTETAKSRRGSRPKLQIMLDVSASMQTQDIGDLSRLEVARDEWLSHDRLDAIGRSFDLSILGFDKTVRPLGEDLRKSLPSQVAIGQVSHIARCVKQTIQQIDVSDGDAALLVLSDGRDSDRAPMQTVGLLAKARGIPIHTVCLGGPVFRKDLVLIARATQGFLLVDTEGGIDVRINQTGLEREIKSREKSGRPLVVHARCEDITVSLPVTFDGQSSASVVIPIRHAKGGIKEYRVWLDTLAEEVEGANNSQKVFLDVVEGRLKVLVLEGEPYWDTKFLAASLRKDARLELTQITRVSPSKQTAILTRHDKAVKTGGDKVAIPRTAGDLAKYDVVIVGRGLEDLAGESFGAELTRYVADRSGNVVFARGQSYDAKTPAGRQMGRDIAVIEPVVWDQGLLHNMVLSVSPSGRGAFLGEGFDEEGRISRMPGLSVMPVVARIKTGTIVMANALPAGRALSQNADAPPALVSMNYGKGRVVAVLGEGLWRWSLGASGKASSQQALLYDEFWSRMVGWLAMGGDYKPGQTVSLLVGRGNIMLGAAVLVEAVCKVEPKQGFHPKVRVLAPDGQESTLAMHPSIGTKTRLTGQIEASQNGVYTVTMECPGQSPERMAKQFNVYSVDTERINCAADPIALAELSSQSGGESLMFHQAELLMQTLANMLSARQGASRTRYIWDHVMILVALLIWAGVEWILRRKAGLL